MQNMNMSYFIFRSRIESFYQQQFTRATQRNETCPSSEVHIGTAFIHWSSVWTYSIGTLFSLIKEIFAVHFYIIIVFYHIDIFILEWKNPSNDPIYFIYFEIFF